MTENPSPLSTRECAEYLGVSTDYIVRAIRKGQLRAERILPVGAKKPLYRIEEADFIEWLKAIGYRRMPKTGTG